MTDIISPSDDLRVDIGAIERSLSEIWRVQKQEGDDEAVTRAALWNVVAHTASNKDQAQATDVLCQTAASVPQRTIIIHANPADPPDLGSWIGANCHLVAGNKQVCSEEIVIVAGGDRVHRVPPLMNALLIPDMPVAFWWLDPATVYALGLALIAAVYIGFAVADGRPSVIVVECVVAAVFVVLAAAGVTGSAWLLVVGFLGHGLKDLWQHRSHYVADTRWWPPFCLVVDWVVAAAMVVLIVVSVRFH